MLTVAKLLEALEKLDPNHEVVVTVKGQTATTNVRVMRCQNDPVVLIIGT